jgi:hypothetical protein
MKLHSALLPVGLLLMAFSCNAQNGPTPPAINLSWVQSIGSTNPIAKNCVYRGTSSLVYTLPALFCSTAPVTSYNDTAVSRGTTYFYALTAIDTKGAESAYSVELKVTSPIINSPTGLSTMLVSLLNPKLLLPKPNVATSADGTFRAIAH